MRWPGVNRDQALVTSANRVATMALTAYREGAAPLATVLEAQRNAREIACHLYRRPHASVDLHRHAARAHAHSRSVSMSLSLSSVPRFTLLALLVLAACKKAAEAGGGEGDSAAAKPEAAAPEGGEKKPETAVAVRVSTARTQSLSETIGAIGVVMARPGHIALLSAPAPGRVDKVTVAVGQHVTANETLVELEQATFRASALSAEASLTAAQEQL